MRQRYKNAVTFKCTLHNLTLIKVSFKVVLRWMLGVSGTRHA